MHNFAKHCTCNMLKQEIRHSQIFCSNLDRTGILWVESKYIFSIKTEIIFAYDKISTETNLSDLNKVKKFLLDLFFCRCKLYYRGYRWTLSVV